MVNLVYWIEQLDSNPYDQGLIRVTRGFETTMICTSVSDKLLCLSLMASSPLPQYNDFVRNILSGNTSFSLRLGMTILSSTVSHHQATSLSSHLQCVERGTDFIHTELLTSVSDDVISSAPRHHLPFFTGDVSSL